jgi:glucose 1-dehydrogenase
MQTGNLAGQTAVISGGLGDIGMAIAMELAGRSADVALSDLHPPEQADSSLERLRMSGVRARYDRVDVTDPGQVDQWLDAVAEDWQCPPSLIIPSAATITVGSAASLSAEAWRREIDVNLHGVFNLASSGGRRLLRAGQGGRIVFIGSWAAQVPHPRICAYSVAKAGLRMLCRCMALEWAPHGILVNEVAPGYVDAGLSALLFRQDPGSREQAQKRVPVGRLILPEEVARQVAQLCDPDNHHVTGSVVLMDGGLSLLGPASTE